MHKLGLRNIEKFEFCAKLANTFSMKCMGALRVVNIEVFRVKFEVDMHVLPHNREGYPLISQQPWLVGMKVGQD